MPASANEEEDFYCSVCIYTTNVNDPHNTKKGACFDYDPTGNHLDSTPFMGDNGITLTGFRYVGLSGECDLCTFTAYPTPATTGMGAVIPGIQSYTSLGFCAKSFKLNCNVIVPTL